MKQYLTTDDWLIFALDGDDLYYVVTELWPEWLDVPEAEQDKPGAVEKYMVPVAKKKWNHLTWKKAGKIQNDPGLLKIAQEKGLIQQSTAEEKMGPLKNIDGMLAKFGEGKKTGWDRFEDLIGLKTWDHVIETGLGDPTKEEEEAIMDLGYYGAPITAETIKGLKNGKRYQEPEFSLRVEAPDGVSEKTFSSKKELIDNAKEYSLGDKESENSWITEYGVRITVNGATVDEIFGVVQGEPKDEPRYENLDGMLAKLQPTEGAEIFSGNRLESVIELLETAVKYLEHPDVQSIHFALPSGTVAKALNKLIQDLKK
jgi:hypothetical protein